jgi:predicted regulator of Ras-like GTPase activity (Roadblock/LC7/MglB family)
LATVVTQQATKTWNGARLSRLNQSTAALLHETQATAGVRAVCVFDNRGALLAAHSNEDWADGFLARLGEQMARLLALLEARPDQAKDIELRFEHGDIYVRDLGNAFEVVLCAPQVNWSLLRMTANVAAAPFEKDTELQKSLALAAPSRGQT